MPHILQSQCDIHNTHVPLHTRDGERRTHARRAYTAPRIQYTVQQRARSTPHTGRDGWCQWQCARTCPARWASKVATASTPHATASQGGRPAPAHTDAVLGPHRVESMQDASLRVAVSTCTVAQHQGAAPEVHRRGIRSTSHLGRPMRPTTPQPRDLRPAPETSSFW